MPASSYMTAAVAHRGADRFEVVKTVIPNISSTEVLVRVEATALTRGLLALWYFSGTVRIDPTILGHGFAGVVSKTGRLVRTISEGDHVRVHALLACGKCDRCTSGWGSLCAAQCAIGGGVQGPITSTYRRYHNGGMAQYVRVPESAVQALPKGVNCYLGAHITTLGISYRAVRLARTFDARTIVIVGATGSAGSAAAWAAAAQGFTGICGISRDQEGLSRLRSLHLLTHGVAASDPHDEQDASENAILHLRNLIGRRDIDAVVDFSPVANGLTAEAIRAMRPGGRAVLCGGNPATLSVPYLELMRNQYQIVGMRGPTLQDECAVTEHLARDASKASPLITHYYPLAKANDALQRVLTRAGKPGLVVIEPWATE